MPKHRPAALVTGGAKRIGQAICLKLAEKGFDIAVHYNSSKQSASHLCQKLEKQSVKATSHKCDLTDTSQIESFLKSVISAHPKLNVLINNASVFELSKLENIRPERLITDFSVHLTSPFFLIQHYAKLIGKGNIINITDMSITHAKTKHFSYLLAKKALAELTRMSAVALGPAIRVNNIAPGFILPPSSAKMKNTQQRIQNIPLQKQGNPEHITSALEFFLTNDYVTGQTLFIDGGEHLL